ncbi:MAG: ABC transporter permease [Chloroflexota bacterium]
MTQIRDTLKRNSAQLGLLAVTIAFWLVFSTMATGFLSDFNQFTLLRFAAVQITIAFGQMIALSAGEMNLSLGAIGGAVAMCAGGLMEIFHLDPLLAIPIALALGALMGATNGFLTVRTGINSFVITLATASVYTGLMLAITQADSYDDLPQAFLTFSRIRVMGFPVSPLVLVMLGAAAALWLLYNKTRLGREILAVGSNRRAAAMSGVNVGMTLIKTHMLSGLLAGLAGVMSAAMLADAVPRIGIDWLLPSFAIAVIGGTAITGGSVSVGGAIIGGLLVASITNGVLLLNVSNFFVNLFLGLILLLAVSLDRIRAVVEERWSLRAAR